MASLFLGMVCWQRKISLNVYILILVSFFSLSVITSKIFDGRNHIIHSLGFSVVLFCSTAMIALLVMMLRRSKLIGGELGGPRGYKIATSCLFVFLWLFYVLMSSLEAYGYINGTS